MPRSGFTLVEIMITVAIIGLLAAIGIPYMIRSGEKARMAIIGDEFRTAGNAFIAYAFDHGAFPADRLPAQIPDGMAAYLGRFAWEEKTVIGGQWDWDYKVFGVTAGVSIKAPDWNTEQMQKIDALIDDGNLATGQFRARSGGYIYIIEE